MHNVLDTLFHVADHDPARIALNSGSALVTYGELATHIQKLAQYLTEKGIRPGTLLILRVSTEIETINVALASLLLGCPWTIFSDELVKYGDELPEYTVIYDAASPEADPSTSLSIQDWRNNPTLQDERHKTYRKIGFETPSALAWLAMSSGTNAKSKYIGISYESLVGRSLIERDDYMPEHPTTLCLFKPIAPVGFFSILTSLQWGGTHIRNYAFDQIMAFKPDLVIGSASQVNFISNEVQRVLAKSRLPCLRLTGGSVNAEFINFLLTSFERVQNVYGATETGRVAASIFTSPISGPVRAGILLPGVQVEIVDENDTPVAPLTEGRIRIKTNSMIDGYIFDRLGSRQTFRDGWFYPNDLGLMDMDHQLVITGRRDDILNIGGMKINPRDVDFIMMGVDGIADCLSFERASEVGVPELAAIVVLKTDATLEAVIDTIFKNLKRFRPEQLPRVLFVAEKVPRNDNGKPMRRMANDFVRDLKPINLYFIILDIIRQLKTNRQKTQ